MFLKNIVFLLIVLISGFKINYAQEKTIKGLVVIDFKNEHPEGVIITNKQTNNSVLTDISGSFMIKAEVGDTLYLNGAFLQERKFAIKESHFQLNPLIIHMNQEVIQLEEIIVRPALTGDLQKDVNSVKILDDVEKIYANLGIDIRTLDMEPKEKVATVFKKIGGIPIPTSLNVEALYKAATGYYRKIENLRQYEYLDEKLRTIKEYFGPEYFTDIIGIAPENAREFLLFIYGIEKQAYDLYYNQKDFLSIDQMMRKYADVFKKRLAERENQK